MSPNPYGPAADNPFSWERMLGISTEIANELQKFVDVLFPPLAEDGAHTKLEKTRAIDQTWNFLSRAAVILDFITNSNVSVSKKDGLVSSFFLACLHCVDRQRLEGEYLNRLRADVEKLRAKHARRAKLPASRSINQIVWKHTQRLWSKNQKRKQTAEGTARDIEKAVNVDLKQRNLPPLKLDAIRKRVKKIQEADRMAAQPSG